GPRARPQPGPDPRRDAPPGSFSLMPFRLLLSAVFLLLLAACARQPLRDVEDFQRYRQELAAIQEWQLSGKMNLRVPGESDTVRVIWQNRPEDFAIRLSGALGMGATWIRGDARQ